MQPAEKENETLFFLNLKEKERNHERAWSMSSTHVHHHCWRTLLKNSSFCWSRDSWCPNSWSVVSQCCFINLWTSLTFFTHFLSTLPTAQNTINIFFPKNTSVNYCLRHINHCFFFFVFFNLNQWSAALVLFHNRLSVEVQNRNSSRNSVVP